MAYKITVFRRDDPDKFELRCESATKTLWALTKIGVLKNKQYCQYGDLKVVQDDANSNGLCGKADVFLHTKDKKIHLFAIDVQECE